MTATNASAAVLTTYLGGALLLTSADAADSNALAALPVVRADASASLSEAIGRAAGKTVLISTEISVAGKLTIGEEVHLWFLNGGRITGKGGASLVIKGPVTAPLTRIFTGFVPGRVKLPSSSINEVYPQWWGAKGNGTDDDTVAFQSALKASVALIRIPRGNYRITKPLDVTNRFEGLTLRGNGHGQGGSILVGETGDVVIDAAGSRYLMFENFVIKSGKTDPSTVGILYQRTQAVKFVEFNSLANVRLQLGSAPQANSGNGTVGIYNNAAELWRARNIYIMADNPVVFTGSNVFKITSPHVEKGPYSSMSVCSIDGASTLHAHTGPALTLENAVDVEVLNTYLTRSSKLEGFPFAIKVVGFSMNAKYTGHVERFRRLLHTQSVLRNPTIECTMGPPEQSAIYLDGTGKGVPGILGGKFNVGIVVTSKVKPHAVIEGAGKQIGVMNATIYLHGQQGINVRTGRCTGNTIHAIDRDPEIRFPASPGWFSYMVMSPKGIALKGPVAIEQQIPFDQWKKPKAPGPRSAKP